MLSTALPLLSFPSLRGCTRGHGKARLAPVFPSEWEAKQGRHLLPLSTHPPTQAKPSSVLTENRCSCK